MRETDELPDDDLTPWTPDGRARVLAAGAELAEAVRAHAEALAAASGDDELPDVFGAGDDLVAAVLSYVDAQFEYTGTGYPLGVVADFADEGDGEELHDGPTSGITVLQRADYEVTDSAAVLAAGRAAYKAAWPDDSDEAAAADVTDIGRAIYQVAHAHGWDALAETRGLEPTGAATLVHQQHDVLGPDPDEWPDNLFVVDGSVLHDARDVYS